MPSPSTCTPRTRVFKSRISCACRRRPSSISSLLVWSSTLREIPKTEVEKEDVMKKAMLNEDNLHLVGEMLMQARRLLLTDSETRLLFFVVPLPCITNSRYMSHEHLLAMMQSIGFSRCIEHHFSNKLAYYLFELDTKPPRKVPEWKKTMLPGKEGGKRNNFAIVLGS